jgi:predicted transcriptional regulator
MSKDNSNSVLKKRPHRFMIVDKNIFNATKDKSAICLYLSLLSFADNDTGHCFPSYNAIKKMTGMTSATISKSIKALESVGLIQHSKGNSEKSNEYIVEFEASSKNEVPPNSKNKPSSKNEEVGSSKSEEGVVQNVNTNYTHLTKPTSNYTQEGAKALPAVKEVFFESLSKSEFKKQGKNDPELVKRFVGSEIKRFNQSNPNKYPREFLEYFYNAFTYVNEHENKSKASEHLSKRGIPSIGQTLPNWFKNWKPQKNNSDPNQCFAEKEYNFKNDKLRENLDWIKELQEAKRLNMYEGEQVGKIN